MKKLAQLIKKTIITLLLTFTLIKSTETFYLLNDYNLVSILGEEDYPYNGIFPIK